MRSAGVLAAFGNAPTVTLLGIVTGLQYALLAVGIVLVYKASRFVNFAHGQMGVVAAAVLAKLAAEKGWPYWPALAVALLAAAAVGALIERLVIGRLFHASRLVLLVATIGVAQILFVFTILGPLRLDPTVLTRRGYPVPFTFRWRFGGYTFNSSQVLTLIVAPLIAAGLYLFFTRTATGKAIRAAASNADAARLAGISVRRISLLVWVTAGVLSGLTAILLAPSQPTLDVGGNLGPSLLLRGLGAALIGRMTDLPTAFVAGIGIGVVEQSAYWNVPRGGTSDLAVLVVILIAILVRGRGLAATSRRGDDRLTIERSRPPLPERLRTMHFARNIDRYGWGLLAAAGFALPLLPGLRTQERGLLLALMGTYAIVGLSLTLLTGWAGQASLGHFAFLAVGAYTAFHADRAGLALPAVMLLAGVVTAGVAVVVGLPALRFRGLFLAATTLAFALAAQTWLFVKTWVAEDSGGSGAVLHTRVPILGAIETPRAVYYATAVTLALCVLGLRAIRGSAVGRAMIAVRDNERAASSQGLNPTVVKITALALSGCLAGFAGALWAAARQTWTAQAFDPTLSLTMLSMGIVGGLGTLHGPILGTFAVWAWPYLVPDANTLTIRAFTSGALLLVILLFLPGGLASLVERARAAILRRLGGARAAPPPSAEEPAAIGGVEPAPTPAAPPVRADGAEPAAVRGVSISFGGVAALQGATIRVGGGEIVGLIGGNGAGKTTLMNCVSGHLRPDDGAIELFACDVTAQRPEVRPRLGVARSFQDAHLYPGLSVLETVMVAIDRTDAVGVLGAATAMPWARAAEARKRAAAAAVLARVGLTERAGALTGELSTGMRRLCETAAVMAASPRLVLLDEPTAGIAQREVEAFAPLLRGFRDTLGCSVLIVEHDMPLLMSLCDRIYALESGTVIAEGTPREVRENPRVIASYLGTDVAAIERSGSRQRRRAPAKKAASRKAATRKGKASAGAKKVTTRRPKG